MPAVLSTLGPSLPPRDTRNANLSLYTKTPEQKLFVLNKFFEASQQFGVSLNAFCRTHTLNKGTVSKWITKYEPFRGTDVNPFCETRGRRGFLGPKAQAEFIGWLKQRRKEGTVPGKSEMRQKISDLNCAQSQSRGIAGVRTDPSEISSKQLQLIMRRARKG